MLGIKAGGGVCTRRSNKNRRTCTDSTGTTGSLNSGNIHQDSKQGVWSELSEGVASSLSKSVVSVALCDGSRVLFACSGIAIECQGCVIRFLTSASLVRALYDKTRDPRNLKIEVRHEGNVVSGFLAKYDLDHGLAVVVATSCLDVQAIRLSHVMEEEFLPCSKVVAVGRDISGKLMATGGVLTNDSSGSEDSEELMLSTCTICEVTKSAGANISRSLKEDNKTDLSTISKKDKISDDITRTLKKNNRTENLARSSKKKKITCNDEGKITGSLMSEPLLMCRLGFHRHRDVLSDERFEDLNFLGYPKDRSNDDKILVNTFGDTFGDTYGGGVWSELSETVSSNISRNVVALASFYGERRIFACTGFFIEWNGCLSILTSASLVSDFVDDNKIIENLRIEVLLPTKQFKQGTLQHCNLHYNVALVSIKDFCASHPIDIEHQRSNRSRQLVSVGYCFQSGTLMAARGIHMNRLGKLDCKLLQHSTCKITKAGIGGPLFDFDGKFVGMSFYDIQRTRPPFLSWDVILDVLTYFKTKRTVPEVGYDSYKSNVLDWTIIGDQSVRPNSWPVPKAFWCSSDSVDILGKPCVRKRGKRYPCRIKIINGREYQFV